VIEPVALVTAEAAVDFGGDDLLPLLGGGVPAGRHLLHVLGHDDVVGEAEIPHVGQVLFQRILRGAGGQNGHCGDKRKVWKALQ
jgi:hypothetical protein